MTFVRPVNELGEPVDLIGFSKRRISKYLRYEPNRAIRYGELTPDWARYVENLKARPLAERLTQPDPTRAVVGVYLLANGGRLQYIGQSNLIGRRLWQHARAGKTWDSEWWLLIPDWWPFERQGAWLNAVEYGLIHYCEPPMNRHREYPMWCYEIAQHALETDFKIPGVSMPGPIFDWKMW